MQNLFTTSYYGLGVGLGGVLSSIGYQLYGPQLVFECAAAVSKSYVLLEHAEKAQYFVPQC